MTVICLQTFVVEFGWSIVAIEDCIGPGRSQEQLGYIVFSGVRRSNGVQGLRVIVQSDRHPAYVEDRIEAFLQGALDYLEKMTDEEFLKHRAALAAHRLEKPKRMAARASQIWTEITSQVYNFDRPRVEVEQLNTITKDELIQFYKTHISDASPDRQKLSVHVVSTAEGGAGRDAANGKSETKAEVKSKETGAKRFGMHVIFVTPLLGLYSPNFSKVDSYRVLTDRIYLSKSPVVITDLVEFKTRRPLYPHPIPFTNIPRKGAHCKL